MKLNQFAKNKYLNKKASHVTVILSMVIFVGFVVFLLVMSKPGLDKQNNKEFLIDSLKTKIFEKVSSNLTTLTITNKSNPNNFDCLQINNENLLTNISVKDKNNNLTDFKNNENLIINWSNQKFFKIYSSEEKFNNYSSDFTCDSTETNYKIENLKTDSKIFQTKIIQLINQYNTEYNELEQEFNIPQGSDFNFKFEYENKTQINPPEKNISVDIFVKEFPVQYVNKNAEINLGIFTIKVW